MALHPFVNSECAIDPPLDDIQIVGLQPKRDILGPLQVSDYSREFIFVVACRLAHSCAQEGHRGLNVRSTVFTQEEELCNCGVKELSFFVSKDYGVASYLE